MTGIVVHEWLAKRGGSENVVEEIVATFPDAQLQSLWNDAPQRFTDLSVAETWLARTPLRKSKALALPFMPTTWRHLGRNEADWILCSSHLFSHHARFAGPARAAPKLVYAHTPARYIWTPELDARGNNVLAKAARMPLQRLDRERAQEARAIAANSEFVRQRIQGCWNRDSVVIHPPVDVQAFADDPTAHLTEDEEQILDKLPATFLLGASRFIPYKRLDLVVSLGVASDTAVVLAGDGPSLPDLQALADQHPGMITFVLKPSRALLSALYRRALAYVFPAIEDFGIMPVEAMATGTPVIARDFGGAAESVVHGVTGVHLNDFTGQAGREAVALAAGLRPEDAIARAWQFDKSVFRASLRTWVDTEVHA
ncbi:glycosyltransferase [Cryobacterium sp. SO1]|uniref:glycosyltransferase n=1 Tax=Cryobacterium sp. SO1 TaxID=1897061 RepID=UPI001022BE7E|nr:glycosyltransferase [Cryobacterium sp. SO1]RZI35517.1 GDP-mannose-dependent alpha-(1-6)-phosphatidylinositol monomannoside mannosyltransferase [Cryobacterium sp. SO1]